MSVDLSRITPDLDRIEIESVEQVDALVYEHLRRSANAAGIAKASKRSLEAALPMSSATAQRSVARLREAGCIELVRVGAARYQSQYRVLAARPAPTAA